MNFNSLSRIVTATFLLIVSLLLLAGCGGSNNTSTTGTGPVNNTADVIANFGPNGATGGFVNGIYVTVTVCQHGTTKCVPIPDVLVDTGSIGLRLIPPALQPVTLTQILQGGSPLEECIQYGDSSYSWGPMQLADVQIAGEQALNIPVQVVGATSLPVPSDCLTMTVMPGEGNNDTVQTLGANGILGIGGFAVDCPDCTTVSFTSGYPYYTCPNGSCGPVGVPTINQAANPIAAFSSNDKNGVMITFPSGPSVPATGQMMLAGTMTFGIGTQSDNALSNVTVYAMDPCARFQTIRITINSNLTAFNDSSCTAGGSGVSGFLDTGSNALYVLDGNTLNLMNSTIADCTDPNESGFYCVTGGGTVILSGISLLGNGGVGSGTISLNIKDATTLFNSGNAVFNDLGGDSGSSPSTDFFDFGAPFFFGRTVFVGIAGESVNGVSTSSVPNGFVAF